MSTAGSAEPSLFPWLPGEPSPDVDLGEFFEPAFMHEFSRFASFEEFRRASPWTMENRADLERVPTERLNQYVQRVTEFDSWVDMRNQAAEREIHEQLLV